jgi:hypothetical protein
MHVSRLKRNWRICLSNSVTNLHGIGGVRPEEKYGFDFLITANVIVSQWPGTRSLEVVSTASR